MENVITFYHNPMSRARIVHWMLEEVGAPYETVVLDLQKGEHKQEKFLAVNPMGKLPTIKHNGVVVTEAAAICAYLADAFPKANLAPKVDDPARGTYYRWLFFTASAVEQALTDKAMNRLDPAMKSRIGYGTYEDTVAALEKAVTPGPFILGDRFSAADVYVCSAIGWALFQKTIEPRPAFLQYMRNCEQREGYKRFIGKYPKM